MIESVILFVTGVISAFVSAWRERRPPSRWMPNVCMVSSRRVRIRIVDRSADSLLEIEVVSERDGI